MLEGRSNNAVTYDSVSAGADYFFVFYAVLRPHMTWTIFPGTEEVEDGIDFAEAFFIIIFTIMAFAFVPAAWIMYIVREKDTKCKHQQVRHDEIQTSQRSILI